MDLPVPIVGHHLVNEVEEFDAAASVAGLRPPIQSRNLAGAAGPQISISLADATAGFGAQLRGAVPQPGHGRARV